MSVKLSFYWTKWYTGVVCLLHPPPASCKGRGVMLTQSASFLKLICSSQDDGVPGVIIVFAPCSMNALQSHLPAPSLFSSPFLISGKYRWLNSLFQSSCTSMRFLLGCLRHTSKMWSLGMLPDAKTGYSTLIFSTLSGYYHWMKISTLQMEVFFLVHFSLDDRESQLFSFFRNQTLLEFLDFRCETIGRASERLKINTKVWRVDNGLKLVG